MKAISGGARCISTVAVCVCTAHAAFAAETTTYTYDALGRLIQKQVSGGPSHGVTGSYQYDAADNRTLYQVTGAPGPSPGALTSSGSVANVTSTGVVIGVTISGADATGAVTFTEGGIFIGSAVVIDGQASIVLEGFSLGTHTITATYSGDGSHAPSTLTFTIKVQDLSWLPVILDLILSN